MKSGWYAGRRTHKRNYEPNFGLAVFARSGDNLVLSRGRATRFVQRSMKAGLSPTRERHTAVSRLTLARILFNGRPIRLDGPSIRLDAWSSGRSILSDNCKLN